MNPTQAQLDARLNPTAVTYRLPSEGLFRGQGDNVGSNVYKRNPDGSITQYNLATLATEGRFAYDQNVYNNAKNYIKDNYGLDFWSLPEYILGDVLQQNGGRISQGNMDELRVAVPNAQTVTKQVNTQPNTIDQQKIKDAREVEQQQLGTSTQNAQSNTTSQTNQPAASGRYTFKVLPNGNVEMYENGQAISSGGGFSASYAATHGFNGTDTYSPTQTGAQGGAGAQTGTNGTTQGTNTTNTQGASTGITDADVNAKLLALGLTQDQINGLNATQKALLGAVGDIATNAFSNGTGVTLDEAIKVASQDPNIIAKYGDALKIDQAAMTQGLAELQQATNLESQQMQQQFEADRKALAEQHASQGTALSGFRQQATKTLADTESGIVQSSRLKLQKALQDSTRAFEEKWGSNSTTPYSATFLDPTAASKISASGLQTTGTTSPTTLTASTIGGVTGTQPIAKQNDILNKAQSLYTTAQTPQL